MTAARATLARALPPLRGSRSPSRPRSHGRGRSPRTTSRASAARCTLDAGVEIRGRQDEPVIEQPQDRSSSRKAHAMRSVPDRLPDRLSLERSSGGSFLRTSRCSSSTPPCRPHGPEWAALVRAGGSSRPSYKILVLLAMLNEDRLPGRIEGEGVRAWRSPALPGDRHGFRRTSAWRSTITMPSGGTSRIIRSGPGVAARAPAGSGTSARRRLRDALRGSPDQRERFWTLAREIVEWRLAEHLDRSRPDSPVPMTKPTRPASRASP
jgi:hypothetical protein